MVVYNGRKDYAHQTEGGPNSFTFSFNANGTWTSDDPATEPPDQIGTQQGVVDLYETGQAHGRWSVSGAIFRLFASTANLHLVYRFNGRVVSSSTVKSTDFSAVATCDTRRLTYQLVGDTNGSLLWMGTRR